MVKKETNKPIKTVQKPGLSSDYNDYKPGIVVRHESPLGNNQKIEKRNVSENRRNNNLIKAGGEALLSGGTRQSMNGIPT